MDDLTITRLCAEAMGYRKRDDSNDLFVGGIPPDGLCVFDKHAAPINQIFYFDPLHNDAQAMALVKRFTLRIDRTRGIPEQWGVYSHRNYGDMVIDDDLNRAICQCVANIQAKKGK